MIPSSDTVRRQTILSLVITGGIIIFVGILCSIFTLVIGLTLVAFGLILFFLPAAIWRVKSVPGSTYVMESPAGDGRVFRSTSYTNYAFDSVDPPQPAVVTIFNPAVVVTTGTRVPSVQRNVPERRSGTQVVRSDNAKCSNCRHPIKEPHVHSVESQAENFMGLCNDLTLKDLPPRYSAVIKESPLI